MEVSPLRYHGVAKPMALLSVASDLRPFLRDRMSLPHQNEEPIKRYDSALASTRVYVLDLCLRKALCLRFMFSLLRRLSLYGLDTSLRYTQVAPPLNLQ
ncbi:hypothetical protein BHE74_00027740 [Ensete ventricosum]|nr:hypothetical protein BHE74_00027740 [Ensete ventricosum]